ncbi:MAG: T9SS type A sorting domain-containing protein [Crocinitomicaceae bacterium]
MKKLLLILILAPIFLSQGYSQCTTTNATSCVCEDGTANCLLLPDITASWKGIANNGFTEYPQTGAGTNYNGQGSDNGRLRVTGSTPNIGHGSFTVRGQDANGKRTFLCGSDTIFNVNANGAFTCPNGYPNPKQLITQRIYKKDGNTMTYVDQYAGSVTYHPAHGHNHVDDWAVMTLRIQTSDPNPLNWPIVGSGAKIGFCLMDYGQCGTPGSTYDGHCRDDNTVYMGGNILYNVNFPNWNLGGGNYDCSVIEQGISSGWTDVYGKYLDGMWINIPPNTCNGDYYIVMEVDKNNIFLEENDDNNYTAVPVTLTLQHPAGSPQAPIISSDNSNNLCDGQTITLTATAGTNYLWSTGDTTQSITVTQAGSYTCEVTNYCGTNMSDPFVVNNVAPNPPIAIGDTICVSGSMELTATASGDITWYDEAGNFVGAGPSFTTPNLTASTTYYVQNTDVYTDSVNAEPHSNGIGGGGWVNSEQYEIFNSLIPFTLQSVLVYAQNAGSITVDLQDELGVVLQTTTVNVPVGSSRVDLNFDVPVANNLRLVGKNINTGGLYRNNNSATYPYDLPGVLSIIGASAGASYYYFFYDWEIHTQNSTCPSDMVPVEAVVSSCAAIGENVPFKNSIRVAPNPNEGIFNVAFETPFEGTLTTEILNMLGTKVYENNFEHQAGFNHLPIETKGLAKGVYIFNILFEGKNYPTRLIIE